MIFVSVDLILMVVSYFSVKLALHFLSKHLFILSNTLHLIPVLNEKTKSYDKVCVMLDSKSAARLPGHADYLHTLHTLLAALLHRLLSSFTSTFIHSIDSSINTYILVFLLFSYLYTIQSYPGKNKYNTYISVFSSLLTLLILSVYKLATLQSLDKSITDFNGLVASIVDSVYRSAYSLYRHNNKDQYIKYYHVAGVVAVVVGLVMHYTHSSVYRFVHVYKINRKHDDDEGKIEEGEKQSEGSIESIGKSKDKKVRGPADSKKKHEQKNEKQKSNGRIE